MLEMYSDGELTSIKVNVPEKETSGTLAERMLKAKVLEDAFCTRTDEQAEPQEGAVRVEYPPPIFSNILKALERIERKL